MSATTQTPDTTTRRPAPGTWVFENAHSSLEAVARHLVVSKVRGRFAEFEGTVAIGEELTDSRVEVTIDAASIDTNAEDRDQHLRSPDFLDVENFPTLRFESREIERVGDDRFKVRGPLEIRGVTNDVELDVTYLGLHEDPWGNEKAVFTATAKLPRERWGMSWNQALEKGGVLVGKELDVEINVQLQKAD